MEGKRLHIINAALPSVEGESSQCGQTAGLYELTAAGGVWQSIERQNGINPGQPGFICLESYGTNVSELNEAVCLDLQGKLLLPGLVDVHMHLDKAFSLESAGNKSGTLLEAIHNYSHAVQGFTKEAIKSRMIKAALMALSYGTTTVRSHLDFHLAGGKELAFRTIEAALEAREALHGKMKIEYVLMTPYRELDLIQDAVREALDMGIDLIGGAPHLAPDPQASIDFIYKMAERTGKPVDLHADESDDPAARTVVEIARMTKQYGMQGRVTVDHLCSLSAMTEPDAEAVIQEMADAGIYAVTLPAVNLYLQGRGDKGLVRRGTTRIRELLDAGIGLAAASDNIQDPFHPYGRGDLAQIAAMTSYTSHMGGAADMQRILSMITTIPATIMGLKTYGIAPGNPCEMVITGEDTLQQFYSGTAPSRWVYSQEQWQAVTVHSRSYIDR